MQDKYIGLSLAVISSIAIGTSYVITKKGLQDASEKHGFAGDGHQYLKNPIWWSGMIMLVGGEAANFAAYAFAPAILVTPLGALSVLTGAVVGAFFLNEQLGRLGKLGCGICLIGSVIIASHAPPDKEIKTVDEILVYAIQPGFLIYCIFTAIFSGIMIYKVAPKYGKTNPLYYLSICALTGSVSVMSVKAFGIALKLTFGGANQFTHPSTYAFIIVTVVCIMTQMNYFNKALNEFSQSIVNPIYYVTFTTAVLVASFILFQGFNTANTVNTISLICGFLIIFSGVYLLNISRQDPTGHSLLRDDAGIPTDGIASVGRLSMQSRRSAELNSLRSSHRRSISNGSIPGPGRGDQERLMHSYDLESARQQQQHDTAPRFSLDDLAEDSVGEQNGERADAVRMDTFKTADAAEKPVEDVKMNGNHYER